MAVLDQTFPNSFLKIFEANGITARLVRLVSTVRASLFVAFYAENFTIGKIISPSGRDCSLMMRFPSVGAIIISTLLPYKPLRTSSGIVVPMCCTLTFTSTAGTKKSLSYR